MPSQNHIERLEESWPPVNFDEAEKFLATQQDARVVRVKKGLFTCEFRQTEDVPTDLEVEVLLTNQRITKTTCDCTSFKKTKRCKHILAVLILIRRILTKKKKKKPAPPKRPSSLNIQHILADAPADGLRLFAREYARNDAAFSILLKTRFIRTISLENDHQKYTLLLNQIIKIGSTGKVSLDRSKRKVLTQVIESLLLHVDEALVDKQYRDAFDILDAVLRKMHVVIDRNEQYASFFYEGMMSVYHKFSTFLKEPLPPELKQLAIDLCIDLASRSNYLLIDLYQNAIIIIAPIGKEMDMTRQLFDLVLSKNPSEEDQKILWLSITALLFHATDSGQDAKAYFHRVEQVAFASMIEHLVSRQEYQIVLWLTKILDFSIYRERNKIRIHQKILEAATMVEDFKKVQHFALELMIQRRDISYYQLLLNNSKIPTGRVESKAEKRILTELDGEIQTRLLAEFYIASQKPKKLLEILIFKNDIDFFIKYDIHVLPGLKHELTDAYLNMIEDHLVHYAGNANAELIQKWKNHFEHLNLTNEINEVFLKLQEAHPERQILYNQVKKR